MDPGHPLMCGGYREQPIFHWAGAPIDFIQPGKKTGNIFAGRRLVPADCNLFDPNLAGLHNPSIFSCPVCIRQPLIECGMGAPKKFTGQDLRQLGGAFAFQLTFRLNVRERQAL